MDKEIKVGSDFSGVGAFNQSLIRLGIKHKEVFACDMDKYARQTFILNYGEPEYYPANVYEREIPEESLDIYMTSPPCQAFSLAGKRKGEEDERGVLFYNSHEFIQKNKPRFFIFENVKGLLSDDNGKTFQRWIDFLGGKTVNGNPVIFPHEESVPYHVYYQVLNAKHYGIPQNRERIFIIGIRDDADNDFSFPKPFPLEKRLRDVLEKEVDEKYFLSDKMISGLTAKNSQDNGFTFRPKSKDDVGNCVTARCFKMGADDNYILGYTRDANGQVTKRHKKDLAGTLHTASGGGGNTNQFVVISSNTAKGYDIAEEEEDSINFSIPTSKTRRGRVGKRVSQTLDTKCDQGIVTRKLSKQESDNIILSNEVIQINPSTESGGKQPYQHNRVYDDRGVMTTLDTDSGRKSVFTQQRIRRLTPLECMRLMGFNQDFMDKTINSTISDSQLYKQCGNSIVVDVLAAIISKIKL